MKTIAIDIIESFLLSDAVCPSIKLHQDLVEAIIRHGKTKELDDLSKEMESFYSGNNLNCFRDRMEMLKVRLLAQEIVQSSK